MKARQMFQAKQINVYLAAMIFCNVKPGRLAGDCSIILKTSPFGYYILAYPLFLSAPTRIIQSTSFRLLILCFTI